MPIQQLEYANQHAHQHIMQAKLLNNAFNYVLTSQLKHTLILINVWKDVHQTFMVKIQQELVDQIALINQKYMQMILQIYVLQHVQLDSLLKMLQLNAYKDVLKVLMLILQPEYAFKNVPEHKDYLLIQKINSAFHNAQLDLMVILFNGSVYKAVQILPQAID
jgi:hypothetical protein